METSALHRELGIPARTQVTFELLSELVANTVREQADLDFKRTFYHTKNDKDKNELVKDICAMANSGGGWIICGIAEVDSAAAAVVGVNLEVTSETNVHQLLQNRIDPPLTVDIRVYQSTDREKALVGIRVPASANKPHLMRTRESKDTRAFQVPVRKGASTVWLDERALRDMYRKSFNLLGQAEDQRAERLDELTARAAEEFPGVALALVLCPDEQLVRKPDKKHLRQLLQDLDLGRFSISQGFSFLQGVETSLSVGDRRYCAKQSINRLRAFIEVDFDGTIAIAIQLAVDEPDMGAQGRLLHANQPDETTQNMVEYALSEAFNFASQLSYSLNPSSDSQLQVCLIPHENAPIVIRSNEGAWSGSLIRPREEATPIKHFRTITRTLQASTSRAKELEVLTELVVEALNQGGIETIRTLQPLQQPDEAPLA